MDLSPICSHKIEILNFQDNDSVNYPLIRLIVAVSQLCPRANNNIITILTPNDGQLTGKLLAKNGKNKVKFLLRLSLGENDLVIRHGCQTRRLLLRRCQINSQYTVMPLYVICRGHDGCFQARENEENRPENARARIQLACELLQCFTADKMYGNGFGRKTFQFDSDCQIFDSRIDYLKARKMTQEELWREIGRELIESKYYSTKIKFLAFVSCTYYNGENYLESKMKTHEDLLALTEAYVALGGGGLALFGSACFYCWPEEVANVEASFENDTSIDKKRLLDDSRYRGTFGACYSTTLGSVLHELYHTLDLGHTDRGIMGRGFDNVKTHFVQGEGEDDSLENHLTDSCLAILAYHKWLNCPAIYKHSLTFDCNSKIIKSTAGIRVIEIRILPLEMVRHFWTFKGKILRFSFKIPDEALIEDETSQILFVQDNCGNTVKKSL